MIEEIIEFPEKEPFVQPEKEYDSIVPLKSIAEVAVEEITGFNQNNDPIFRLKDRRVEETLQMIRVFNANRKGELVGLIEEAEKSGKIKASKEFKNKIKSAHSKKIAKEEIISKTERGI